MVGVDQNIKLNAQNHYKQTRIEHWDTVAELLDSWQGWGGFYHQRLTQTYRSVVPRGQKVLEIGCGRGDLLASLKPSVGVGIDFSHEMTKRAKWRHPELFFIVADAHEFQLRERFDVIILSDLINEVWDVQTVFERISEVAIPRTRLIINLYSRLWQLPLALVRRLGLAKPLLEQNWLTVEDIFNLLDLTNFEVIRSWQEIIWPLRTPLLAELLNQFFVKIWPFNHLALTNFVVARPRPRCEHVIEESTVSVIIPARNEAGNIPQVFERVPRIGKETELVFIEGHSRDETYDVIKREIAHHPDFRCKLIRQTGIGKGDAVRYGFAQSSGAILMILDADLTVPPEDLSRFYEILRSGKAEFVNGVRLVYPMEKEAMRFMNLVGNKFFSLLFSWLLGQPIKDTLCGTKALWRADYGKIETNRGYFGDFDPFGDFDLLFGAAKLNLTIVDLPIRYSERTYGTTNIQRWQHGWLLLKMALFAAKRIKFI
jgi:SAM-dependent methyltransferase